MQDFHFVDSSIQRQRHADKLRPGTEPIIPGQECVKTLSSVCLTNSIFGLLTGETVDVLLLETWFTLAVPCIVPASVGSCGDQDALT